MAAYVGYQPSTAIGRALFNFGQTQGTPDFRYSGLIQISTSDGPVASEISSIGTPDALAGQFYGGMGRWTQAQLTRVDATAATFANFANLSFAPAIDYPGQTPAQVGTRADINIAFVYRPDQKTLAGLSAVNASEIPSTPFKYSGADGDIFLNSGIFGDAGLTSRPDLSPLTILGATLQHEIGHSLGLAHPHLVQLPSGARVLTSNFAALGAAGFEKLGFAPRTSSNLDQSYFSVMSYGQTVDEKGAAILPQTPMILDVIALQEAYGVGRGTHGSGDDLIAPGGEGTVSAYRTYFDVGGVDTIDLLNYVGGASLYMGERIEGASGTVGVSMSRADAATASLGGSPKSLRWFYGDYEKARGGPGDDRIIGNALPNQISGGGGNDLIDGGAGVDTAVYTSARAQHRFGAAGGSVVTVTDLTAGRDGVDQLANIEFVKFTDQTVVSPTAVSALSVALANQMALAYLGRGVSFDWRNAAAAEIDLSDASTARSSFYQAALKDGAIADTESMETLIDAAFWNIFGVGARSFEQQAWTDVARDYGVARADLPWTIFASYLGSPTAPAAFQLPAQSRLLALDAFTTAAQGTPSGAPGETAANVADAARAWLRSVNDPGSSAQKILAAQQDVSLLATTALGQAGTTLELIGVAL